MDFFVYFFIAFISDVLDRMRVCFRSSFLTCLHMQQSLGSSSLSHTCTKSITTCLKKEKPKLWTSYKTVIKSEGIYNKNQRTGIKEHQKWINLFQSHWLTLEIQQHFASTWSFHKRYHSTQELWDWDPNGLQSPFPAHTIKYPHPDMGHICHSKIIKWVRFPVWCQWRSW